MAEIRKFLDQSGVEYLWTKIKEELNKRALTSDTYNKTEVDDKVAGAVYDDTDITKKVEDNTKDIQVLESDSTVPGSVAYQIAQIVGNAPDAYNTLEEIAAWIAAHPENVAAINASIKANTDAIQANTNLIGTNADAIRLNKEAIEANASAIQTNTSSISTNTTAIQTNRDSIEAVEALVGNESVATQLNNALYNEDGTQKYLSEIPPEATQEIYEISNENELITLNAQRGDLAEIIEVVDGERTIVKLYQLLGDSATVRENWVILDTSAIAEWFETKPTIESAIQDATSATASANDAANVANRAANRLSNVTMDVEMLAPNAEPTANVEQSDTQTNFSLGIPKSNYVYATFEVDENMDLLMYAPEGFEGVSFELNDGVLEVNV